MKNVILKSIAIVFSLYVMLFVLCIENELPVWSYVLYVVTSTWLDIFLIVNEEYFNKKYNTF